MLRQSQITLIVLITINHLSSSKLFASSAIETEQNQADTSCLPVKYGQKNIACKCDAKHCDQGLKFDWPSKGGTFLHVTSNSEGSRFFKSIFNTEQKSAANQTSDIDYVIKVKADERHHEVTGYGGAFTDSANSLILGLEEPVRSHLLNDYFGPDGLDYNMGRVAIGGTDMSERAYSYDDQTHEDHELRHFKLQDEDLKLKIPLIKLINDMRAKRSLEPLKLIASCWSPPAWMKDNQNLVQGNLKGSEDSESLYKNKYYETYAKYLIKFLEAYEAHNLTMWALSAQNEPRSPKRVGLKVIHHNSVNFSPNQLVALYKYHLIPLLAKTKFGQNKLRHFVWEDVLDDMEEYLVPLLSDASISNNISGVAIHWYSQASRRLPFSRLERAYRQLPFQYSMISTEASHLNGQKPGDWEHGSAYALDLIQTIDTGLIGWLDWNLALDPSGGPTWAKNPLDSAVQIDLKSQSYIKNPMFYALGHVTRFIPPGSNVIDSQVFLVQKQQQQVISNIPPPKQSEVFGIAAELKKPSLTVDNETGELILKRRLSIVLTNQSNSTKTIKLDLINCRAMANRSMPIISLEPSSIHSFAFVC